MPDYSYMDIFIPRDLSREAARQLLTEHAEYGQWELSRVRLYPDGSRRVRLRRRIMRVRSTL
ncbi:DUF5703 family protein [Nonomuraea glycinis]|uniref:Dihydroorotate dehydrogenase n=2 Tax=Nonomuraea glycinis TaxID=2047744 RepID=A0A918E2U8_9ACTN|nr:DUF5703 family protein [Nonomuraea glycinis]MCA2176663.1 DUF5703 family protein [Nonomuraea glycinis]WSG70194.1 DUF5703 family protein [Nonomuraea glycinis]GGP03566.1 hypothetical protein GCM10012278_15300 [Nonomuraea glycinis]